MNKGVTDHIYADPEVRGANNSTEEFFLELVKEINDIAGFKLIEDLIAVNIYSSQITYCAIVAIEYIMTPINILRFDIIKDLGGDIICIGMYGLNGSNIEKISFDEKENRIEYLVRLVTAITLHPVTTISEETKNLFKEKIYNSLSELRQNRLVLPYTNAEHTPISDAYIFRNRLNMVDAFFTKEKDIKPKRKYTKKNKQG